LKIPANDEDLLAYVPAAISLSRKDAGTAWASVFRAKSLFLV
jgi:hypothetical protein